MHMTTQNISYGYCHCGCGEQTKLAPRTDSRKDWIKGQPMRYIAYHGGRVTPTPIEQRFWSKVDKHGPDECWNWTDFLDRDGYGSIASGGKRPERVYKAHRYSYELHYGVDPGKLFVMHKCDNPACVNPAHLELGTNADNVRDCWNKGRATFRPSMPGASHPLSKVTPEIATQIRIAYRTRDLIQTELAIEFGVSKGTVYYILKGKHWTVKGQPDLISLLGRNTKRWRMTKRLCKLTP
jgi:DNA-binding XRE family transcriptional regulator